MGLPGQFSVTINIAGVHNEFPWLAPLTEKAWRQALRRAKSGFPAGVGAMLLSGPPGLGKSSWARAVAQAMSVPALQIDVGATGGAFDLQGVSRGWSSSDKGRLVSTIMHERVGNPLVVLDEIDAGSHSMGTTRGSIPGLYKVLMGMIEPSTAGSWVCPYYQIPFDLRHVSWVCSANTNSHIEQALLDRLMVVEVPAITPDHLLDFVRREAERRFEGEVLEVVVRQVSESIQRGHRPSLRQVVRLLDRAWDMIDRPLLH